MIKSRIQIKFAVVAMATLVSMTAFLQASESAIEVTSSDAEISVSNPQQSSGENNTNSGFSKSSDFQTLPNVATNLEVEVQTRFNEIRSELLDERASYIDLWLTVIGLFLGLFALVVPIVGFMGFKKFREIEVEGKASVKIVTEVVKTAEHHLQKAEHHLQEIRKKSDTATDLLKGMHAKSAAENPTKATLTVKNVQDDPYASLIDKAIANALSLQQQKKQEDAKEKWRAIAQITEESDNALAARAWFSTAFLSSDDDLVSKISSYDRAIQLKPDFSEAYCNRGNSKYKLGRYEDALADYDKAIQLKPDMAEAYSNRGISKYKLGRYEDALADYDKATQLKPDMADAYFNRGTSKSDLGQYEDAITDYDKAIQLKPDMANAYFNRGNSKSDLGQYEDALADYDKATQLKPDMADAYYNRGNAKGKLGRHEDAIVDYGKAIQINPDMAGAYCNRGNSKSNWRQYEDAIADYDKAIELNPEYAKAYVNRGIARLNLGFSVEAKSDLETALELAQNSDNVDLVDQIEPILHTLSATNGD